MTPKPDVSGMRTAQIIEAATTIFAAKGFDGATMVDIATQAGINKATIYLYFESKDDLIRSIAEELFAQELADLEAVCNRPGTATERLRLYYEALIAEETEVLPLMPIVYEFYALGLRREDVRAVLVEYLRGMITLLTAIIQEGITTGEFAPTDARKAARALDALLNGIFLHWVYAPEEVDIAAQLRYGVQLIFRGLLKHVEIV
ncbi:MAG: TetR/AcrR family transcriptional regulator [Chloroflexota bacterium]|nr:TetR/AcrR family transcriptional regulator [Chloroflexota bacterium]